MYRFSLLMAVILVFALAGPLRARDFTVDDFDPADPAQAETYRQAVEDFLTEVTIVATDNAGNELFRVVPFPLELIALMTQLAIHDGNVTDPGELRGIVDNANLNKPAANSFAFIISGDPEWADREVSMYYLPADGGTERVNVDLVRIVPGEAYGEGEMISEWAMFVNDVDQLTAFLASPAVALVVGADDPDEAIELDCGFWRQWGLFDVRREGDVSADQQSSG